MIYRFSDDEVSDAKEADKNNEANKYILEQLDFHFMFNSMNMVKAMTLVDTVRARELIDDLASIMRYRIRMVAEPAAVLLNEEFKQAKCFADIEMGRYSNVNIEIEDITSYGEILIPGLSVVALIENAVRHGIRGRSGGGLIRVYVKRRNGVFVVSVRDNGIGFKQPEMWIDASGEFTGNAYLSGEGMNICSLRQIKKRVEDMVGGSLCIMTDGTGTLVEMFLPV